MAEPGAERTRAESPRAAIRGALVIFLALSAIVIISVFDGLISAADITGELRKATDAGAP